MKNKLKLTLVLLCALFVQTIFAQQLDVSGTVYDNDGNLLPGVNITVKGEDNIGTQTDFDGNYSISVDQGQTLVFSFVGFEDQEVVISDDDTLDVTMEMGQNLDEVVVIGYGSQKRLDNTSAVSSLKSEDITKTKVSNINQAIQGKIAGVQITTSDEPGSTPSVSIRGMGTVLGGRNPLYVVDGMFTDNIDNLNPNDIESYDVLKDASALAIYGNRAANGAIIITTKKGKEGLSVEYDGYVGIRSPLKKVGMANAEEYVAYTNAANGDDLLSSNQPYNTNWFDEITRTGVYNQHNVSVSGASDNARYLFSLSNYNEKGFENGTNFNRTTLRTNNDFDISKHITLSQNLNMSFIKNTLKPNSVFTTAYKQAPLVPVRFDDGQYGMPVVGDQGIPDPSGTALINNVGNPVAAIDWHDEKSRDLKLQGGLKLDIDFSPFLDGLKFTTQFNGEYQKGKSYNFDNGKRLIGQDKPDYENQLTNVQTDHFDWVFSNFFSYTKTFDVHSIEATLGMEASDESGLNSVTFLREDMEPNKSYWNLSGTNYADNVKTLESVNTNNRKTISYFGRVQYKLMDRYLVTATLRRDGSSQFSKGNKWGTFPSFGAAWILSKENFLIDNDFIDNLKIRGGWGRLGNQNVPLNVPTFSSGSDYRYSFNGQVNSSGQTVDQLIDPNLSWEITEEASAGIDFEFLDRRLSGSFDWYDKKTTNIILPSIPVSSTGINKSSYSHMGQVSNTGIEAALGWQDQKGDFGYSINVNFSHNKNRLDRITGNINPINGGSISNGQVTKYFASETVGQPLGSFYLWEIEGYDDNGNFVYRDNNDNGSTGDADSNDRRFLGSYIPKETVGISLGFSYKDWDLSLDTYGAFGQKVYNGKKAQRFSGENIEGRVARDFWAPNNTDAANPTPFNAVPISSDYYLESGDYFRINNITLGYTFTEPTSFLSSVRVYANAINPFIIQSYSGYTPELNADGDPYGVTGVELSAYPALRSFVFGANINF